MRKPDPIQLPATPSATLTDEESLTPVLFAIEVDRTKIGRPSRQMKPPHFSMLRAYRAADFFTLANGAAGTGSIFAVISYVEAPDRWRIYLAFCLVPLALLLDIADGRIARRLNEHSLFGGELDSLRYRELRRSARGARLWVGDARRSRHGYPVDFCGVRDQPPGAL